MRRAKQSTKSTIRVIRDVATVAILGATFTGMGVRSGFADEPQVIPHAVTAQSTEQVPVVKVVPPSRVVTPAKLTKSEPTTTVATTTAAVATTQEPDATAVQQVSQSEPLAKADSVAPSVQVAASVSEQEAATQALMQGPKAGPHFPTMLAQAEAPPTPPPSGPTGVTDEIPALPETRVEAAPQTTPAPEEAPEPQQPPPNQPEPPQPPPPPEPSVAQFSDSPFATASSRGEGYGVTSNTTGLKIDVPSISYPGTVNTVPFDVIQDQQILTTQEAIRNVPGAYSITNGGRSDAILLRGFQTGFFDSYRRDGLIDPSRVQREMQNVERIEVLKGPSSFLYGASSSPAGIINYITKKPLQESYSLATFQPGYFDLYRTTVDTTGPIGDTGILYRFNAALEHADSFRNFINNDRWFVAPQFSLPMGDDTLLTFSVELLHDNRVMDRGIPIFDGDPFAVPYQNFLGQPDDRSRFANERFSVFLEHRFSDDWNMRLSYGSGWSDEYRNNFDTRALVGTTGLINRAYVFQSSLQSAHDGILDITGNVDTFGIRHQLLFGSELNANIFNSSFNTVTSNSFRIDIFDPDYSQAVRPDIPLGPATWNQNNQYAFYLQDLISVNKYVKLLGGVRYNIFDQNDFDLTNDNPYTFAEDYIWMPRFGLVLEPVPEEWSFYIAYGESFNPVLGLTADGIALRPETGKTYEVGTKALLLEKLLFHLAYYQIKRGNVTQADPLNPNFNIQIGEASSHGIEAELTGAITDRWTVTSGYAYTDTVVTEDTNLNIVGKSLLGIPSYTVNLWSRYNLYERCNTVIGVALGTYAVGPVWANNTNTLDVPSYVRWDAGLYLQRGNMSANFYFENLGDVRYIAGVQSDRILYPGAPFNMRAQVGWQF